VILKNYGSKRNERICENKWQITSEGKLKLKMMEQSVMLVTKLNAAWKILKDSTVVSSAKRYRQESMVTSGRSLSYVVDPNGPNTVPCGTPIELSATSDLMNDCVRDLSTRASWTNCFLIIRNECIHASDFSSNS
jgi:hypothetical protein